MEHALGCIVGALVGDAAGAPLEFNHHIKEDEIKNAIHMNGGGALNIGQGQITDDGELTLALANSLMNSKYYSMNDAAYAYHCWIQSHPFDIGTTCRKAFTINNVNNQYADVMLYNAAKYNMFSEANGALMRLTPIPIRFWKETDDVITQLAKYDALLSHPNPICLDTNAIFALALAHLIKSKGDHKKTFHHIADYITNNIVSKVKEWFTFDRFKYLDCTSNIAKLNIGHVKHAFCMSMNFLENPSDYQTGIEHVVKMGGDTDTNACICGALLGAIHGYQNIPECMRKPVLSYKFNESSLIGYNRPSQYHASNAITFIKNVF